MLVSSVHDNKDQIYYKKSSSDDDDENAKVMRVKSTSTFTGEGQVFNQYGTVSWLIERELPSNEFPYVIHFVPIPGLPTERNRDSTFQKNVYVLFLRNTVSEESVHLNNHEHYHK